MMLPLSTNLTLKETNSILLYMVNALCKSLTSYLKKEWKTISYVFLGAFLLLFGLNLSAMLSFMPTEYSTMAFNVSVFTSAMAIVYIVYTLHEK